MAPTASVQMSGNKSGHNWLGVVTLDVLHTLSPMSFITIQVKLVGVGTGWAQERRTKIQYGSPGDFQF